MQLEKFDGANYLDYHRRARRELVVPEVPLLQEDGLARRRLPRRSAGPPEHRREIDTPLANEEFKSFKGLNGGKPVENTLYYHYARLIEALFAAERVRVLLDDPDILSTDILNTRQDFQGAGRGRHRSPARHADPPLLG